MATEIETRLLEAAERLEEKLERRAEEVREHEALLLGHLESENVERAIPPVGGGFERVGQALEESSG